MSPRRAAEAVAVSDLGPVVAAALARGDVPPPAPGVDAVIGLAVTGGPGGDASVTVGIVEGTVASVVPASDQADVTFTLPWADATEVLAGRLQPSVAFMRGRLKTSGDDGTVLRLLAATATSGFAEWIGALGEGTGA